jgi:hypothetical protein
MKLVSCLFLMFIGTVVNYTRFESSLPKNYTRFESSVPKNYTRFESSLPKNYTRFESSLPKNYTRFESSLLSKYHLNRINRTVSCYDIDPGFNYEFCCRHFLH